MRHESSALNFAALAFWLYDPDVLGESIKMVRVGARRLPVDDPVPNRSTSACFRLSASFDIDVLTQICAPSRV